MPLTRFTLRQIQAFLVVAELHSFTDAADRLSMTTQAVSQLVSELETILGFRLLDRTTRRVSLSSAGRDFLPAAETMFRHVRATETIASDVRQQSAGIVRIGAPLVLACTAVPSAIRVFQEQRPRVIIRVHDVAVDNIVDSVIAGDVDLAVGPDRATGDRVTSDALFDSRWVLWCSPDHPLAQRKKLTWRNLRNQPLVAAGYDHERSVAQMHSNMPKETRVTPIDIVDNITTAFGIAAQGKVATLAPAYTAVLALPLGLVMRRVLNTETVREVCLYRPNSRGLSPAAEGFAEHLLKWMPTWSATVAKSHVERAPTA